MFMLCMLNFGINIVCSAGMYIQYTCKKSVSKTFHNGFQFNPQISACTTVNTLLISPSPDDRMNRIGSGDKMTCDEMKEMIK